MGEEDEKIVTDLSLMDMKELAVFYERLTKHKNEEIKKEAESILMDLLHKMKIAIKNGILSQSGSYERMVMALNKNKKESQK